MSHKTFGFMNPGESFDVGAADDGADTDPVLGDAKTTLMRATMTMMMRCSRLFRPHATAPDRLAAYAIADTFAALHVVTFLIAGAVRMLEGMNDDALAGTLHALVDDAVKGKSDAQPTMAR